MDTARTRQRQPPLLILLALLLAMSPPAAAEVQSLDGAGNNLANPDWGAADTFLQFALAQPRFADGVGEPAAPGQRSARNISAEVFSSPFRYAVHGANDLLPYFGQFACHDIAWIADNASQPLPIPVSECDDFFDAECAGARTIPFFRSNAGLSDAGVRVSQNWASTWVDASTVYGYSKDRSDALRTFQGGKLKVSTGPTGDLLPLRTDLGIPMENDGLFAAGDVRANVNLQMVCLHTLFHLEHNLRAEQLAAANPSWDDQMLFDEARKYVIALMQKELYYHYVPVLIGKRLPEYTGYNSSIDPAIDTAFMTAAFRYGHSSGSPYVYIADEMRRPYPEGHLNIGHTIFNPAEIFNNGMDRVLRGVLLQPEADADVSMTHELRNHNILLDLAARDIQRNRERGVGTLNQARVDLGMDPFQTWADLTPDTDVQALLQRVYETIDDVELYVGGLAERPVERGIVPPTFNKLIARSWDRLRAADRFHYENPDLLASGYLTQEIIDAVNSRSLSAMVLDHTQIASIANDLFIVQESLSADECAESQLAASDEAQTISPLTGVTMAWKLDLASETINIELTAVVGKTGWVGIGFNTVQMIGSDVVLGFVDTAASGEPVRVIDAHIPASKGVPVEDSSQDIEIVLGAYADGMLIINFTRPLGATDSEDSALGIDVASASAGGSAMVDLIFARGSRYPAYHGMANRVILAVDLNGGTTEVAGSGHNVMSLYAVHGFIMFLMWMVAIPWSAVVAHYFRTWKYAMEVHQTLAQAGAVAVISFAASALVLNDKVLDSPHAINGLCIVFWMLIQIVLGWYLRIGLQNSTNLDLILRVKRLHRYSGYLLSTFAVINCYLGVSLLFDPANRLPRILFLVYVVGFIAMLVAFEGRRRRRALGQNSERRLKYQQGAKANGSGSVKVAPNDDNGSLKILDSAELEKYRDWTWKEFNDRLAHGQALMVLNGLVIDVREYMKSHPAGAKIIDSYVGVDITDVFHGKDSTSNQQYRHSIDARNLVKGMVKARIQNYSGSHKELTRRESFNKIEPTLLNITEQYVTLPVVSIRELNNADNKVFEIRLATDPSTVERWLRRSVSSTADSDLEMTAIIETMIFGQHLKVLLCRGGRSIVRLYTPTDTVFNGFINFIIKTYPNGEMTTELRKLHLGQQLRIHGPFGPNLLSSGDNGLPHGCWKNVIFFAGGSGLTPALATFVHHVRYAKGQSQMWLLFANTSEDDFYYIDELKELQASSEGTLRIKYLVTKPIGKRIAGLKGEEEPLKGPLDHSVIEAMNIPLEELKAAIQLTEQSTDADESPKLSASADAEDSGLGGGSAQGAGDAQADVDDQVSSSETPAEAKNAVEENVGENSSENGSIKSRIAGGVKSNGELIVMASGPYGFCRKVRTLVDEIGISKEHVFVLS